MTLKKYALAVCVMASALSFTACSKDNASSSASQSIEISADSFSSENIIATATERNLNQKSAKAKMVSDFSFKNYDGKDSSAAVETNITAVTKPVFKHITMNVTQNGDPYSTSEFYTDENDKGEKTLYIDYGDKWYQMPVSDEELFSILGQYDVREVLNILLSNISDVTVGETEDINGTSAYKVDGIVKSDVVPDVIINSGVFVANGLTNLYTQYFEGVEDMPVTLYIDSKTGDVVKFSFDAGNAFQVVSDYAYNLTKDMDEYKDSQRLVVNAYKVGGDIYDIDSTEKTEIPDEVKKGEVLPSISEEMEAQQKAQQEGTSSSAASTSAAQ